MKKLSSVVLVVALAAVATPNLTPKVHAGTTNCGSLVGFADVDVLVRSASGAGGRRVFLITGRIFDEDHASIQGPTQSTDRTWIDRRRVGSSTWTQCGPFNRPVSNEISNPRGSETRACMDYLVSGRRQARCTSWYPGH